MSHKKNHTHPSDHEQNENKKTAEMKTPETPNEDALFSEENMSAKEDGKKSPPAEGKDASKKEGTYARLEADLHQANDRTLRALAELENYRKRVARELDDMRKYANVDLIRDMLPVWDNMGRAMEAVEKTHDAQSLIDGVRMMHEQFVRILKQHHCEPIEALKQPFDPNVHEAISQMPNAGQPAGTVLYETQIGFKLYDRVVRPTQVVIVAPENK